MKLFQMIILIGCLFMVFPNAMAKEWSQQEKIARLTTQQTFHWGQPGEAIPNNGWSDYSKAILDFGGNVTLVSQRNSSEEISIKVISKDSGSVLSHYVYRLGTGLLSYPKKSSKCTIDGIEGVGLYVEAAMYMVSRAFPKGPESITSEAVASFFNPKAEYRFMGGIMRTKKGGGITKAMIKKTGSTNYAITIHKEGIKIEWYGSSLPPSPSNDELLSDWLVCSEKLQSAISFGEVRGL